MLSEFILNQRGALWGPDLSTNKKMGVNSRSFSNSYQLVFSKE